MRTWITPSAFAIAATFVAFVQADDLIRMGFTPLGIAFAITVCVLGGLFWGAFGTLIYRRFVQRRRF